jgi:uncharacterized linocin/CFP29 family protein
MTKDVQINSAVGSGLVGLNPSRMRPFINASGRPCIIMNGKELQTNAPATLRYDEWKDIDRTVIEAVADRLVGVADLIGKGLVHPLGSIGMTIALWERSSDMTPAEVSMSGTKEGEADKMLFDTQTVPVPVIHKDWRLNIRHLEGSRALGAGLDVSMAAAAGRLVAEKSEDMLFAGAAVQVDGGTVYGYTTHPDRNTVAITTSWTNAGKTGAQILANVQAMLQAARSDGHYGPYTLYIPGEYEGKLDDDFAPGTSDSRTIRQRIMALSGISEIKVADRLANDNVVLVQMTREVVDLARAQDVTTVQWENRGGMTQEFKTMAVWVPRLKSRYDGQSGIVHMS